MAKSKSIDVVVAKPPNFKSISWT